MSNRQATRQIDGCEGVPVLVQQLPAGEQLLDHGPQIAALLMGLGGLVRA